MNTLFLTTVAALQIAPAIANDNSLSLPALVREVRAHNPVLQAARANWGAMRERAPQAAAWEDPRTEITQTIQRFPNVPPEAFTDNQLTLEQTLPISGKNRSRARVATADARSALQELRRAELDAVQRATIAFYKIANTFAKIELNERTTVSLKQLATISRAKYEVGRQSQSEVLTAEVELSRNAEARFDLDRQLSEAESELNALLNRPAFASLARPAATALNPPQLSSPKQALAMALSHRPEMQMARAKIEAALARVQLTHREWIPDPAMRVSALRYNDTGRSLSEVNAGVAFNLPWLNARKYSAQIREAENALAAARHELEARAAETAQLVRDHLTKIETFTHHYELYHDNILPLAQQTVKATQSGYEADKSSFLELVTAQRNTQSVELEMLNHLLDAQMAAAEFAAMLGAETTEDFSK